ncbi:hypothetical protein [Brevundimonas faecalis]|uniref:Uncharacterized protein n=1 Tax=Brevundimonas faecalis TaxID=947378 RepID=A0ABV2RAU9_9CAUL
MDDVFTLRPGEQLQAAELAIAALIAAGEALDPNFRSLACLSFPDAAQAMSHRVRGAAQAYLSDHAEDEV